MHPTIERLIIRDIIDLADAVLLRLRPGDDGQPPIFRDAPIRQAARIITEVAREPGFPPAVVHWIGRAAAAFESVSPQDLRDSRQLRGELVAELKNVRNELERLYPRRPADVAQAS